MSISEEDNLKNFLKFLMRKTFKGFLNLLKYNYFFFLIFLMIWLFSHRKWYVRSPPGIEPALPALEGKGLTSGLPGRSRKRAGFPLCLLYAAFSLFVFIVVCLYVCQHGSLYARGQKGVGLKD